jgi:hypothetical protein
MSTDSPPIVSTRAIADQVNVPLQAVCQAVDRLNLGVRVGRNRAILSSDVPRIIDALIGGGSVERRVLKRGRGK